jgi:hypothetical protein
VPRLLRYFLVWLSCTAVTVSVVFLTVRFVVHSTAPMPPTAHAKPTSFDEPTLVPSTRSPSPVAQRASPSPKPASSPRPHRTAAPSPHPSFPGPSATATASADDCQGGAGTHTIQSRGGQVTIRWGAEAVCLVSAVPAQGFTTRTGQSAPDSLTVTFEGTGHRSQIAATLRPEPKAVTTETSW